MNLSRLILGGFQSYEPPQIVDIQPDITLLAGRNNVGKTALLRALQLAAGPLDGARPNFYLEYQWSDVPSQEIGKTFNAANQWVPLVRGAIDAVERQRVIVGFYHRQVGPESFPDLPLTQQQPAAGSANIGQLGVRGVRLPDVGIAQEWIRTDPGNAVTYAWTSGPLSTQEARNLGWYHAGLGELASELSQWCARIYYVMPRRVGADPIQFSVEPTLANDGRNLTNVIATLYVNRTGAFEALEGFIRTAFPEIARIRVPMSGNPPIGEIRLEFAGRPESVPLRYCGTGIEQLLVIATAILTVAAGTLFLLDEPHAYLHPHAERTLLRLLQDHPEHQYLVATHSNLLLSSLALSSARLVSLVDGWTNVTSVQSAAAVLEEIGVTPADLWSNDFVLWVEGPTEVAVNQLVAAQHVPMRGLAIRPMPGTSRFGAASAKVSRATFEFCQRVSEAVSKLPVKMLFVFDNDEKTNELKREVDRSSNGRARFLDVREIENYFLVAATVHHALAERAEDLGLPAPSLDEVQTALNAELAKLDDPRLYRQRVRPEAPDTQKVAGSEVLRRLYWQFTSSEFDKVADGRRLAGLTMEHQPAALDPIRVLIEELVS